MKRFKKFFAFFLSTTFLCAAMSTTTFAAASLPNYIRVGLRMSYEEKSSIPIESTSIRLVRSSDKNNPLQNETVGQFNSPTGFNMRTGLSYQVAVPINVSNFEGAKSQASAYISKGYTNALPGYYKNNWAVVIFGYSDASSAAAEARALGGAAVAPNDVEILDVDGNPVFLIAESDAYFMGTGTTPVVDLGARSYRGIINFMHNSNGTLTAVNIIDFEEYLYGVVASEIPSEYAFESIKAQACAARSYALFKWNMDSDIGYDICDSTHCQAYMGYDYEDETSRKAVTETKGELIYHNGKPIEALFFSSSGGYTEDSENVWGTEVAYLKAVDDSQEINCPTWSRTITLSDLDNIIAANGYGIGPATGMRLTIDNKSKRVQKVEILGTNGTKAITLEACRTVFSALGSSFSSRSYTIENGTVHNVGGETDKKVTVDQNLGTFVSKPIKGFLVPDDYIIGADCAVVYSNSSSTVAYGYDGNEVSLESIPDLDGHITVTTTSSGDSVVTSNGSTINITGKGIGHGVGMSQMGANGMAQNGANYKQILQHYYTGVTVE